MKHKPVHSAFSMVTTLYRGCIANLPHRPSPILNNSQYAPSASQPFTTKHNPPQSSTDPNTLRHPSHSPRLNPNPQCTLMDSFLRWQSPRPHCNCACQACSRSHIRYPPGLCQGCKERPIIFCQYKGLGMANLSQHCASVTSTLDSPTDTHPSARSGIRCTTPAVVKILRVSKLSFTASGTMADCQP